MLAREPRDGACDRCPPPSRRGSWRTDLRTPAFPGSPAVPSPTSSEPSGRKAFRVRRNVSDVLHVRGADCAAGVVLHSHVPSASRGDRRPVAARAREMLAADAGHAAIFGAICRRCRGTRRNRETAASTMLQIRSWPGDGRELLAGGFGSGRNQRADRNIRARISKSRPFVHGSEVSPSQRMQQHAGCACTPCVSLRKPIRARPAICPH